MKSNVARLRLEALEEREVPSTVSISIVNIGNMAQITITGDANDNQIKVEAAPFPAPAGRIRITALGGTTISSVSGPWSSWVSSPTVVEITPTPGFGGNYILDLNINMGGGNDSVQLLSLRQTVNSTQIAGNLTVILGDGNDLLQVQNVEVRQNVSIYGGIGNDQVYYLAPTAVPIADRNIIDGNLLVDLGTGDNIFTVTTPANTANPNLEVKGSSATILSAEGNDVIRFGDNTTSVSFKHSGPGATVIQTGGGKDRVLVYKAQFGTTNIDTGGGHDRVVVNSANFGTTNIYTRSGNDKLRLQDAIFGLLVGLLGAGNDVVNFVGTNVFGGGSLIDGGPGTNTRTGTPPATLTLISI
ncbi:MAG: hypothetical protein RMJ88_11305 [Thermogemmata sp.]|nr:hypothetical protein [Thermogemmata sp.]